MASSSVLGFLFDDDNEDKLWQHGITIEQVQQVLDGLFLLKKNRRQRRASKLIIGRDAQGQCLAIPIEPTPTAGIWRPVTAWFCKQSEWVLLPPRTRGAARTREQL